MTPPCQPASMVSDTKQLAALEEEIRTHERGYIEVGIALSKMRRLFPTSDAFEAHVRRVFGWARSTVYQKIRAAEIAVQVRARGPAPDTELAALALSPLSEAQRLAVWEQITRAGGKQTYSRIARQVEMILGHPPGAAPGEVSDEMLAAFHSLPEREQLSLLEKARQDAIATGQSSHPTDRHFDERRAVTKLSSLLRQLRINLCSACQSAVEQRVHSARPSR